MSGIVAHLKFLLFPVFVAVPLTVSAMIVVGIEMHMSWTNSINVRNEFSFNAISGVVMTVLVALPFLRFRARQNRADFGSWLTAWLLAYSPFYGLFLLIGNLMAAAAVGGSVIACACIWWMAFFTNRKPS
jgi:hypothetical protein